MKVLKKGMDMGCIDFRDGAVILIDKALEWTSFDVVNKIRFKLKSIYKIKKIKVGHNGTLDPLASGLLMIFTGKYTKLIPAEENHDKSYEGTIKLGATTASLDTETAEIDVKDYHYVSIEDVRNALKSFIGESTQEIPVYSAAKIKGQRMYKIVRAGEIPEPKYKTVVIHAVELKEFRPPFIDFNVLCGKGTYVRAIARDLGVKLGTSAYLYALRRTAIASYSVDEAFDVIEFCDSLEVNECGNNSKKSN